jgi:hypothetical protein
MAWVCLIIEINESWRHEGVLVNNGCAKSVTESLA